ILIVSCNNQSLAVSFQVVQNALEFLRLWSRECQLVENDNVVRDYFGRQCGFDRKTTNFLRQFEAVRTWRRSEYSSAANPLRGADGALTSAACAFLFPRLATAAAYFGATFRFVRS